MRDEVFKNKRLFFYLEWRNIWNKGWRMIQIRVVYSSKWRWLIIPMFLVWFSADWDGNLRKWAWERDGVGDEDSGYERFFFYLGRKGIQKYLPHLSPFPAFPWQALVFIRTVALCCLSGVSKPSAWMSECHFHDARESRRTDVYFTGMQIRRSRGGVFVVLSNSQEGRIRRISPLLPSLRSAAGWPTGLCQDATTGW